MSTVEHQFASLEEFFIKRELYGDIISMQRDYIVQPYTGQWYKDTYKYSGVRCNYDIWYVVIKHYGLLLVNRELKPYTRKELKGWYFRYYNSSWLKITALAEDSIPNAVGDFSCAYNDLLSLKGVPKIVDGNFECQSNLLRSLRYAPKVVGGYFYANHNILKSLKSFPKKVNGDISLSGNYLTNLVGLPSKIYGDLSLSGNPLRTLKGAPTFMPTKMHKMDFTQTALSQKQVDDYLNYLSCPSESLMDENRCYNQKEEA